VFLFNHSNLSASESEAQWVLTSYLVSNAIILPISGWISSRIGRKMWGAGLDLGPFKTADSAWIQIRPSPLLSCVRVLPEQSIFELYLRIVFLKQRTRILQVRLSSGDFDLVAELVEDPQGGRPDHAPYIRPYVLVDGSSCGRNGVLNHLLGQHAMFNRGDLLEGTLLFQSSEPAPLRFVQGTYMPVYLSFQNRFDSDKKIALRVERRAGRARTVAPKRRLTGLFERDEHVLSAPGSAGKPLASRATSIVENSKRARAGTMDSGKPGHRPSHRIAGGPAGPGVGT